MKIVYILIFTVIKLCLSCKDPQKISLLPPFHDAENFQITKGEDILIVCCHPDGADYLKWEDSNQRSVAYKSNNGIFSLKDEKSRLILRIDNINDTNSGTYKCKHTKNLEMIKSISITLKNKSMAPSFEIVELFFPKNRPIKVECPLKAQQFFKLWQYSEGKGNEYVNMPGKKTNYEISEDKLTFTIIKKNNQESIKFLWCQYQEIINKELKTGFYEFKWILYDPIDVKIELENELPILEGHDVKMICTFNSFDAQVVEFPLDSKSTFITDNSKVNSGRVVLTIPKITRDLEREYICKVTKFLSSIPMKMVEEKDSIKIEVVVPPKIIKTDLIKVTAKENENAHLKCFIDGKINNKNDVIFERFSKNNSVWLKIEENEDKYIFTFDQKKGNKNFLTLLIKNVQWEDRGKYQCTALNAAGKDKQVGFLKVERLPKLYTESISIYMAMEPVKIDCSVSGYPINTANDSVQLRVLNESSPFSIKIVKNIYDEMEGLRMFYEVAFQKKIVEGVTYSLECFYYGIKTQGKQIININLITASQPDIPKVSVLCTGSSGIVFQYEIPVKTVPTKDVIKNELFYAPSTDFDRLTKKSSKIIPENKNLPNKYQIYVLKNLTPLTNYSFKWDSYNIFQFSSSLTLSAETKKLGPPKTPKSLKFSTANNILKVIVDWDDDCPYPGAYGAIKDAYIKMKPLDQENKKEWNWAETNFTLDVERKYLEFPISLEKPQVNYKIEVTLRSAQGSSQPIVEDYRAENVLAGSLFSCFPHCLGLSLSSSHNLIQFAIIAYLVLLRIL